ncbi:MAG: PDZ domain-containing protein, partial [Gammaproteobacteria bacterium]
WPDFEVVALTPELGDYFGVTEGLLLVRVPKDADMDLRDGDVLVEIDGEPVSKERDLWHAMREHARDETVPVKIVRQRESLTMTVSMPDRHGPHPKIFVHKAGGRD